MISKDYKLIAKAVNIALKLQENNQAEAIINELCVALAVNNPRFDTDKFREACKIGVYRNE